MLPYIEPYCKQIVIVSDDVLRIHLRVWFKDPHNVPDMLQEIENDKKKLKVLACSVADISFEDVLEMLLGVSMAFPQSCAELRVSVMDGSPMRDIPYS